MGVCRGMCQYAAAGTPCDCKCGGTLHGIRAGLHAPTTHAGKLHIDLEHAGQLVMSFDAATEPSAGTVDAADDGGCCDDPSPAVDSAAEEEPMEEGVGSGTAVGPAEAMGTGGAGLATAGPAPEAIPPGEEHGATELSVPELLADRADSGMDHAGHDIHDALPGMPRGSDDHGDHRRAVLLDGFRVVPVTREWCEGGAWREWCGWRIDAPRGPFYGATPEEAAVAVRRGTLRIVRAA